MTSTRKYNTFGGTNIHIYLGNKTQKSNSKIPIVTGGSLGEEGREVAGKEKEGEGKEGTGESTNRTNSIRTGSNQLVKSQPQEVAGEDERTKNESASPTNSIITESNQSPTSQPEEFAGEGEEGTGEPATLTNPIRTGSNQLGTSQLEEVVSMIATEHAEDDAKIDKIETLLISNWDKLYAKLGEIKPETDYTQTFKSELIQLIQEMVAVALLQTI